VSFNLRIDPHDPIIARDGRPFGAASGNRMKTLSWLYPSVLAGSLRTLAGKRAGLDFDLPNTVELLNAVEVHGPVAAREGKLFMPLPNDLVRHPANNQFYAARPVILDKRESWDLTESGLRPALLPDSLEADFKPGKLPAFYSMKAAVRWLMNETGAGFQLDHGDTIEKIEKDERTHVAIDAATSASLESMLFTTEGIEFPEDLHMAARVSPPKSMEQHLKGLNQFHSIGGERRLARFSTVAADPVAADQWACPPEMASALAGKTRVRMQLVTPAIFSQGWRPTWVTEPEHSGARLTLVSAAMDRWRPVSGWSYAGRRGPKAIRRMAPAGSVYFFEADKPLVDLQRLWLAPVSDNKQDRRDGFGLAVWGLW
jgi:CRISPR-associated protein Cmr3